MLKHKKLVFYGSMEATFDDKLLDLIVFFVFQNVFFSLLPYLSTS